MGGGLYVGGTVTATSFVGAFAGTVAGNADTASKWATPRTFTFGGDLSGSMVVDGSQNVTFTATIAADSVALGTDTTGNYVATGATSGYGLSGSSSSEGGAFTVTSNGTSSNTVSTLVFRDDNGDFSARSVTLTGNLVVQGTTFTVNSTVTNVSDPIFTIGGGAAGVAPSTDDNKDRGIAFQWHNGAAAKIGFFGYDDSTGFMTFVPDATITNEVVSGTQGDIQATNFRGTLVGSISNALTIGTGLGGTSYNGSSAVTITNTGVTSNVAGTGISVSGATGAVTITNSGVTSAAVSGTGLSINAATGSVTITSNATSANTVSTIVARDSSGNFSAGTITATLSGNATNVSGTVAIANGGSGQTTAQAAMNAFAGAVTSAQYLRGNGTNVVMSAIQAGDVPTLNQNTTGSAGSVANAHTAGTGLSGTTFNGSAAVTWTLNTATLMATAVTALNGGVTSIVAGTGVSISGGTGAVTVNVGQAVATSSNVQFNSVGVGIAGSGTAGEIRATNEITAYYSDRRLKENVKVIDNAVTKVLSLNGITYTPNELAESFGYDRNVKLVGLFADEVEAILPEATRPAPFDQDENGNSKSGENYKTIQYEKLVPLLIEAIKEQQQQIAQLYDIINNTTNK